jgi:hypothetical protein
MKHPLGQGIGNPVADKPIPWSAEGERELRRRVGLTWHATWTCWIVSLLLGALGLSAHRLWLTAAGAAIFGFGITRLYALGLLRQQLGEEMRRGPGGQFFEGSGMLANKPRSTSRLTEWVQHPADGVQFTCFHRVRGPVCGRLHHWSDAQWIPNYDPEVFEPEEHPGTVDPGGGRFVILCPCGLGHFKLKL